MIMAFFHRLTVLANYPNGRLVKRQIVLWQLYYMADCHMAGLSIGKLSYGTLVRKQIVIWHFGLWQIAYGKLYDGKLILAKYQNSQYDSLTQLKVLGVSSKNYQDQR